ncbi:MAG: ATP-binding protein [Ardenticatenaceae bacterium]
MNERTGQSAVWSYLPFILLALCTLILTLWVMWFVRSLPDAGMEWVMRTGLVYAVDGGGEAEKAGIGLDDQIVGVDGRSLFELSSQYEGKQSGEQVRLTVLEGGQTKEVSLLLSRVPLSKQLVRLEPLLIALFFWGAAVLVWVLHPFHSMTRLFFLVSQVSVAMLATGALSLSHRTWNFLFNIILLLLAPLTLHFYASFPYSSLLIAQKGGRARLLQLFYGGAAFLIGSTLVETVVSSTFIVPFWLWSARRLFGVLTLLLALVQLLRRPRHLQAGQRRRLLIAGMIVSLLPLFGLSLLPQLLLGSPSVAYVWTLPFLTLLPLSYIYAIYKGEVGEVDRLLNRSLVYTMLTTVLGGLYVLLFWGLDRFLLSSDWSRYVVGMFLAMGAVVLYQPMRAQLQRQVDDFFYGGWYDYRSIVCAASNGLCRVHSLAALSEGLFEIARTMHFGAAVLLWSENGVLLPKESFGYAPQTLAKWCLSPQGEVARYLTTQATPQWREQIGLGLAKATISQAEHLLLAKERLFLPLVSREQLYGVLVMDERRGEILLDREDLDILATVAGQAAVVVENVALLEALRGRLAEVEQMRDELAEAQQQLTESREAERLHLAQELHDGPIQDLYGARFQLGLLTEGLENESHLANLNEVEGMLEEVTGTLRALCSELRPPTLTPFGLEMAIRSHAEGFQVAYPTLSLQLDLISDGQLLPERMRLTLFRIYQQALNNIARHADATHIDIRFALDHQQVLLEVQDNGRGFTTPARWIELARQGHFGLLGATERAQTIGGTLEVQSAPQQGTRVRVTAPLLPNSKAKK